MGVQLFGGGMHRCTAASAVNASIAYSVEDKAACATLLPASEYTWVNSNINFDHIGNALITLFFVAMGDGWVEIMRMGIDSRSEEDANPRRDARAWLVVYFILFIIMASFLLLNVFMAVILDNFKRMSILLEKVEPEEEDEEETWIAPSERNHTTPTSPGEAMRNAREGNRNRSRAHTRAGVVAHTRRGARDDRRKSTAPSKMPVLRSREDQEAYQKMLENRRKEKNADESWRQAAYRPYILALVQHPHFEMFIAFCVVCNVGLMATEHYGMASAWYVLMELVNYGFSAVFFVECLLKVHAMGWTGYSSSTSNLFDFFLVVTSIVGVLIKYLASGFNPTVMRVLRIFRVGRVLRLWQSSTGLRVLVETVLNGTPLLCNMLLLMFLVFFIFACAGVESFGKMGCTRSAPCLGLHKDHTHFRDFPNALITLFRMSIGDNSHLIYSDTMRSPPLCDDGVGCKINCCAMPGVAPLFFVCFSICTKLIIQNVMVAILMQELTNSREVVEKEDEEEQKKPPAKSIADVFEELMTEKEKKTGVKEKEGFREEEKADWMPPDADPDDEDAEEGARPEKVDIPEMALKPIVKFDFDKRDALLPPIRKSKRACQEMPELLTLWATQPLRTPTAAAGPG